MNYLKISFWAASLAILAVGCASGPRFSGYSHTVAAPAEGKGRIWFYRPRSAGAAVQPAVRLDGEVVGKAVPLGFFFVDTPPGSHQVSCSTETTCRTTVNVMANQSVYVRLRIMLGVFVGHIQPEAVTENRALEQMKDLHLASP